MTSRAPSNDNSPLAPNVSHPPGPKGHWLSGTISKWRDEPLAYMQQVTDRYGSALRIRYLPGLYGYLFCHPEHNIRVLLDNNRNYTKMPNPSFLTLQPLLGNGLLTNDGDDWLAQRRLIQPIFHRRRIAHFGEVMRTLSEQMLARWRRQLVDGQVKLDIDQEMTRLTLEIVGLTLFGTELSDLTETIGSVFTQVNEELADWTTVPFGWLLLRYPIVPDARRTRRRIGRLEQVVDQIIRRRRSEPVAGTDLLSMLMEAEDQDSGSRMTDRQLRDEVMTLLLAGHETTANALGWTFYLLAKHPAATIRLKAELKQVLNGRLPTVRDLPALPYTAMVLKESMRLYPPAYMIARWSMNEDLVGGYRVKGGSGVNLSPYLTHRLPEFWPDPERFVPDRFTEEAEAQRPRFAYIPFGGGPRQCIGNDFAMTEATLILAMVAQSFELELIDDRSVEIEPLITLRPKNGLPMIVRASEN
ncbi:MAG: cytochrome P450 [Candidatus Promineifilaceae bacterium]|nr:cytochrome P450 [Candidatus Promineifilaceae bacterium]